jgi:hypothetical protein
MARLGHCGESASGLNIVAGVVLGVLDMVQCNMTREVVRRKVLRYITDLNREKVIRRLKLSAVELHVVGENSARL